MKKIFYIFIIIALSALTHSCTQKLYTTIDILRPAKVTFSPNMNNALIVNNSIVQPDFLDHLSVQGEKVEFNNVNTDSLSIFCLAAFYEDISSSEFFNNLSLELNSINKSTDFYTIPTIAESEVKRLLNKHNADFLIALERIKVSDKITDSYDPYGDIYISTLEAIYESNWSICDKKSEKCVKLNFKDSIYWESFSASLKNTRKRLPNREDALIDGALYVGQECVNKFIPYWDKEDRYFYSFSNKHIKAGIDAVYLKKWNEAIDIWKKIFENNANKKTQAAAANNIAIAYEIIGDIDNAILYAQLSLDLFLETGIGTNALDADYYLNSLRQRKAEFELLDEQLGN